MFIQLLPKILPLYLLIALGFLSARFLNISKKAIADLLIYVFSPIVFFGYVAQVKFTYARLLLPFLTFLIPLSIALILLQLAKYIFSDNRRHLSAYASACGNTGYFGVPVFIALFGPSNLGLYTLAIVGYMFFETGPGYFILARGQHGVLQSLRKVFALPALYAAMLGLIWSLMNLGLPVQAKELIDQFRSAYVILGMMLIGFALGDIQRLSFDFKFTAFCCFGKLVALPLATLTCILVLKRVFKIQDEILFQVMATFSSVPLAANLTAYATQLNVHPEKVASTVFTSTIIALFTMPAIISWILSF